MSTKEHCGFIGLIGRPNVGKSTLLNKLIGQDLSITTPKPQTTRNRLLGIRTQGTSQMVFIDTPGIHESNIPLNRKMIEYAVQTLEETDLNLWLIEPLKSHFKEPHPNDKKILDLIGNTRSNTMLVINKIDLAKFVGADLDVMERDAQKMRDEKPFYFTNLKKNLGVEKISAFIVKSGGMGFEKIAVAE